MGRGMSGMCFHNYAGVLIGDECYAKELVCGNFFGSRKDEMSGEVPVAFIVQAPGFNLSEEDVKAFVAKQVDFMF